MGQVLTTEDGSSGAESGDYFGDALAALQPGQPATCAGCRMLAIGCDLAASSGGLAVACGLYPLRRRAYFQETREARARASHRARIFVPRE